jgi:hypothetical protein
VKWISILTQNQTWRERHQRKRSDANDVIPHKFTGRALVHRCLRVKQTIDIGLKAANAENRDLRKNTLGTFYGIIDVDRKLSFGPVVVESLKSGATLVLVARQGVLELRNEQQLYRAVLSLVAELEHEQPNIETIECCISEIADRVSPWPKQWLREQRLLRSKGGIQSWFFGSDNLDRINNLAPMYGSGSYTPTEFWESAFRMGPIAAGHRVVCDLVNAFPPQVRRYDENVIEGPHENLTCGIRPLLYYILRREYLQRGRIGVCANTACRNLFEIERTGARFCSEECSRRQRQREYWAEHGKGLRAKRLKRAKSANKVDFIFEGQRVRESAKTRSKTVAKDAEKARRRELEESYNGIKRRDRAKLFSVAAEEWLVVKSLTLAASSQRIERDNLKHLRPHFERRLVTDIQAKDVSRYQHARLAEGASPKTINLEVGTLRAILRRNRVWAEIQQDVRMLSVQDDVGHAITLGHVNTKS